MTKLSKTQRKTKKSKWKIAKFFWRSKRQKAKKSLWKISKKKEETKEEWKGKHSKNLFEEQKQKLVEQRRNYHLTQWITIETLG